MAFSFKNLEGVPTNILADALRTEIRASRFNAVVFEDRRGVLQIGNVRLNQKKPYCGNHPAACERGSAHRKGAWLEGLDWVSWNDMLNDVMDRLNVSARVASSQVVIRKGKERCVNYSQDAAHLDLWKKDSGRFEDWCGRKAPRSHYPEGTPGLVGAKELEVA